MSYAVIDHHLDEQAGVYRLVIGVEVWEDRPVLGENGEPLVSEDEQPITHPELVGHEHVRDYVFAADDERWEGGTAEGVAQAQRELVAAALADEARVAQEAATAAAEPAVLPGVGARL